MGDVVESSRRSGLGSLRPVGWPLERMLHLMAGTVILSTLALGRLHCPRWRILTGFVGANLLLDVTVGWCPASLLLRRLGVPTAVERAMNTSGVRGQ